MSMSMVAPAVAALRARATAIARTEMATGDDNRDAAADVGETKLQKRVALGIREQELFRVVGEDTNAVDTLSDHAVEHAPLPRRDPTRPLR